MRKVLLRLSFKCRFELFLLSVPINWRFNCGSKGFFYAAKFFVVEDLRTLFFSKGWEAYIG